MTKVSRWLIAGGALAVLIGESIWLWYRTTTPPGSLSAPPAAEAPTPAAPATPAPVAAASAAIQYPIGPEPASSAVPAPDLDTTLNALFGRQAVLRLFQLDGFPRRVAATVDNLGRRHAPAQVWPLNPAPGRFLVQRAADAELVDADNAMRYTPYVLLIEQVDLAQLVAAYAQLYPQFQQAYEELGFPGRYFNDRLVQVIDQLLAAPEPNGPLAVHLPPINSPVQPPRPWTLYEFDDPALQSLTAGQKLMLRMGLVNERRVKYRLAELRKLLAAGAGPQQAQQATGS